MKKLLVSSALMALLFAGVVSVAMASENTSCPAIGVVYASNMFTGEVREFASLCDVPEDEGWLVMSSDPGAENSGS